MQFGKVYGAEYSGEHGTQKVAVKLMRINATPADKEEFLGEAELMLLLDHPSMLKVRAAINVFVDEHHVISLGGWSLFCAQAVAAGGGVHAVQRPWISAAAVQKRQSSAPHERVRELHAATERGLLLPDRGDQIARFTKHEIELLRRKTLCIATSLSATS